MTALQHLLFFQKYQSWAVDDGDVYALGSHGFTDIPFLLDS